MKEVPIKNIESVVVDIKDPNFNYERLSSLETVTVSEIVKDKKPVFGKKIFWFAAGGLITAIIIIGGLTIWSLYGMKEAAKASGNQISKNLLASIKSLKDFNPDIAKELLIKNQNELQSIQKMIYGSSGKVLLGSVSQAVPTIKESIGLFGKLNKLNMDFLSLTNSLDDIKKNGFDYFRHDGKALIRKLKEIQVLVKSLNSEIADVQNSTSRLSEKSDFFKKLNTTIGENYVKYASNLYVAENALDGFINLVDTKIDRHFAIFFNNAGELRPGGGFIGSYGDLIINEGQMVSLDVQNIYWPDRPFNLPLKVVPPDPLQAITEDWGARDANWFFDFPASAETVIGFLEASKIYKEKNIVFDGAISMNTFVFKTFLEGVGPIDVPDYDLTIDQNNFLIELQREVEAGKDKKSGDNPKKILSTLAPTLIERLSNLSPENRAELFKKIKNHIEKKDVMIFTKDQKIAGILKSADLDGSVLALPNNFWGSYIAVVNANVAGGKTDVLTTQKIDGRVDVSVDGGSFVDLKITRSHSGGKEKDWWWNSDNQNYLQVFSNPGSRLVAITGNTKKERKKRPNYEAMGYEKNSLVEAIEKTKITLVDMNAWMMEAFGKSVLATWFTVPAGKTKTLEMRYQVSAPSNFTIDNQKIFRFVYERQSGEPTSVKIVITAPFGYKWQEGNDSIFIFQSDDPKAREIVDLHLSKK